MTQKKFKFEEFELDVLKRQLLREGEIVPLNPKAFDLLFALVENNGKLLSKDDLFELVWEDQIVEESNLTVNMSAIRRALGEKANQPRFITTVSGQGYRFVGDVRESNGQIEDTIIESHTLARIVVEEETETEEKNVAEISPIEKCTALPTSPESFFKRNRLIIAGSLLILTLIFGIGSYLWQRETAKSSAPLQAISMKRLTNLGNVTNAALSPDGKLFAYTLQEKDGRRSLWLGHVDGGGENVNLRPASEVTIHGIAFAPDGGSLFYIITSGEFERGALFKIRVFGGAPEKIRENIENFIAFAPDGKQFTFVRNDRENLKSSLIVAETAGASEREIASRPIGLSFIATSPAWSPGGNQIAVSAIADESGNTNEIFTVAVADGSIKLVTTLGWSGIRALLWTKDGSGLYSVAGERDALWDSQIWHISYPNGEARRVVSDLNVYGAILGLSPASSGLLVLQAQHYSNIWVATAGNTTAAKQITFELLGRKSGWDALEWTMDGRIAYTAFSQTSETIWLMDADGKNQKQIIPEGRTNSHLSFSADGNKLVFDSNRSGSWEIWTANADGSQMRQLTTGGNNSQPHISPDGNSIVYRSLQNGLGVLRRMAANGGESVQLTENAVSWARFSPDGKFIACIYRTEGKTKLAVLNASDASPVKLFDFPQSANFNNGIRWTPDGANLTFRDWNNGIWRQNLDGGELRRLENLPEEKLYSYGWSRDGKQFAFTRGTEIRDVVLISDLK